MLQRLSDGRIVDTQTGQIIREETVYLKSNEFIEVVSRKEEQGDKDLISWGKDRPFVKVYLDFVPELALILSGGALAVVLRLTEYIRYGSNLVAKQGGNPVSNKDIQELMGYNERTVTRIMNELIEKKVFFRGRTGYCYQYYANPYLFSRGKMINKTLITMFKDYPKGLKKQG